MALITLELDYCEEHPNCVVTYQAQYQDTPEGWQPVEVPGSRRHQLVEPGTFLRVLELPELHWQCPRCGINRSRTLYDPQGRPEIIRCGGRSWSCRQQFAVYPESRQVELLGELAPGEPDAEHRAKKYRERKRATSRSQRPVE